LLSSFFLTAAEEERIKISRISALSRCDRAQEKIIKTGYPRFNKLKIRRILDLN